MLTIRHFTKRLLRTTSSTAWWYGRSAQKFYPMVRRWSSSQPGVDIQESVPNDQDYDQLSKEPFPREVLEKLQTTIDMKDVEIKPDGIIYVPEIRYRRQLNHAFGPGGWGMKPLSNTTIIGKKISREYGLYCLGRFVSQARGEQEFFSQDGIFTATEGCKSNALMRCCKDLGIFWELWDPRFIREFKQKYCHMVQGVHVKTGQAKWLWKRKDGQLDYPYKEKQ
jgi:hypothetical protein